jgi:sensor histidine kinase YesM
MVVQLLVENAIVHGIAKGPGAGKISVSAARVDGNLQLRVADSGPGFSASEPRQSGIGLANTRSRLAQLYGAAHRLEFGPSPGGGATVTLSIPFERLSHDVGQTRAARAS